MRRVLRRGVALLVLPSLLAAACGNSDGQADPVPTQEEVPFIEEAEFVATLSQRACSLLADCCDGDGAEAACISEIQLTTPQPSGEQYDGLAAAACVDAYAALLSRCVRVTPQATLPCSGVYLRQPGSPCAMSSQCTPGHHCRGPAAVGYGTCVSGTPGVEGDDCVESCPGVPGSAGACLWLGSSERQDAKTCYAGQGLECSVSGRCERLPQVGQGCASYCAPGLYCSSEFKRCFSAATGQRCEGDHQCSSSACVDGLCSDGSFTFRDCLAY